VSSRGSRCPLHVSEDCSKNDPFRDNSAKKRSARTGALRGSSVLSSPKSLSRNGALLVVPTSSPQYSFSPFLLIQLGDVIPARHRYSDLRPFAHRLLPHRRSCAGRRLPALRRLPPSSLRKLERLQGSISDAISEVIEASIGDRRTLNHE
jgi:hypothetical protein